MTSFGFVQTLPLASDTISRRIVFSLSQGNVSLLLAGKFAGHAAQTKTRCLTDSGFHAGREQELGNNSD